MRIVIALGGNALLRRGEPLTFENQRQNIKIACEQIAKVWPNNELVIAHGNGPQAGWDGRPVGAQARAAKSVM